MVTRLRQAVRSDIAGMHRVRMSVRENRLVTTVITEADYIAPIELSGRGWVIEASGSVVAFAVGNSQNASIWALFVDPGFEGHGFGRQLHDTMVTWLWQQGHGRLWLTTEPGTRAQRFYEAAGWKQAGDADHGEVRYELVRPADPVANKNN
jgi:GNAT superfamily N-acetyltransferase